MKKYESIFNSTLSTEEESDDNLPPKKRKSYSDFNKIKKRKISGCSDEDAFNLSNTSDTEESQLSVDTSSQNEDQNIEDGVFESINEKAQQMMLKMGYQKGKGLGKNKQGIVQPIEASKQRGRLGLGFIVEGLEPKENLVWDRSKEHISVEEEVSWIPTTDTVLPIVDSLMVWPKCGPKLDDIKDQTMFCHPKILEGMLDSKSIFDSLPDRELHRARFRCNPFETLGKLFFQNRAALKMANLDAIFDFMFSTPRREDGTNLVSPLELLYFADVCAAPGGFTEYVLWKRKEVSRGFCDAKGFGFTLRENDFKLADFFAASPEFFEPHYGESGTQGTGNVYEPDNITNFRNFVLKSTDNKGVHFMMADGGFSVEGQENIQEILSKQLYLCQFIVALGIVREGGHFVCKLFDLFTPFSIGLIYIMYKCFSQVAIHKPNSSRPANSERYIVCKGKKSFEDTEGAYEYLFNINLQLRDLQDSGSNEDILEIVPLSLFEEERPFSQYMYESNNLFGSRQIVALQKIRAFCQDIKLVEDYQDEMRRGCLQLWQLPDKSRVCPPQSYDPQSVLKEWIPSNIIDQLSKEPMDLTKETLSNVRSRFDYMFVFLSSPKDHVKERGFFIALGSSNVYLWSGKALRSIHKLDIPILLPPDTIFYGEMLMEYRGEGRAQRKVKVLHIIDAYVLNGFNVSNFHLAERNRLIQKFAKSVNKESRNDLMPIRFKPIYKLDSLSSVVAHPLISRQLLKGGNGMLRKAYLESPAVSQKEPARFSVPSGIMILKTIQAPWMQAFSRKESRSYWYNTINRESTFEFQNIFSSNSASSYSEGLAWWWDSGVQVLPDDPRDPELLSLPELIGHGR